MQLPRNIYISLQLAAIAFDFYITERNTFGISLPYLPQRIVTEGKIQSLPPAYLVIFATVFLTVSSLPIVLLL